MDPRLSKIEYYRIYNRFTTLIDLWNNTSVAGTVQDVDGFMNITMSNVVFFDQRGKMQPLDNFFVLARNVKYIHIPKEIDVAQSLDKLYNKKPIDMAEKRPPRTFKLKRAQMNHLQTLREISQQQQDKDDTGDKREPAAGTSSQTNA